MASTSKSPDKLPKGKTKISSVSQLNEDLGLGTAPLKIKTAFSKAVVEWRKGNKTSDGRIASDLLEWQDAISQHDFRRLAEGFLDDKRNGERFWSIGQGWKMDSSLQFPENRERIVELLMQLFWRQNRYLHNNLRATRKDDDKHRVSKAPAPSQERDEHAMNGNVEKKSRETSLKGFDNADLVGDQGDILRPAQSREVTAFMPGTSEQAESATSLKRSHTRQGSFEGPFSKKPKWELRKRKARQPLYEPDSDEFYEEDNQNTNDDVDTEDDGDTEDEEVAVLDSTVNEGTEQVHQSNTRESTSVAAESILQGEAAQSSHVAALDSSNKSPHSASPQPRLRVWTWSEAEPYPPSISQDKSSAALLSLNSQTTPTQTKARAVHDNSTTTSTTNPFSAAAIEGNRRTPEDIKSLGLNPPTTVARSVEISSDTTSQKTNNKPKLKLRFVNSRKDTGPRFTSGNNEEFSQSAFPGKLNPEGSTLASRTNSVGLQVSVAESVTASISEPEKDMIFEELTMPISGDYEASDTMTDPGATTASLDRCQFSRASVESLISIPSTEPAYSRHSMTPAQSKSESPSNVTCASVGSATKVPSRGTKSSSRLSTPLWPRGESSPDVLRASTELNASVPPEEPVSSVHSMTPLSPVLESFGMKPPVPTRHKDRTSYPAAPSNERRKAQMKLFIVTRKPFHHMERWLDGKLQGVSLSEFYGALESYTQKGSIDKVKLTLQTSVSTFVTTVPRNDESEWQTAKRMFNDGVKQARLMAIDKDVSALGRIDVHVEPFYTETENLMMQALEEEEDFF